MSQKLLSRTLKTYVVFSVIVLLVSAPLFYFSLNKINIKEANRTLFIRKKEFKYYTLPTLKITDIPLVNRAQTHSKIYLNTIHLATDSLYSALYYDTLVKDYVMCRYLAFPITVEGQPYYRSIRINLVEKRYLIESIVVLFAVIISLLLIGLYYITKRLSIVIWKPFFATLKYIEQFEIDKNPK